MLAAVAEHRDFHFLGQRVGHRHAHAVQTAGELVSAVFFLVELAAGVQHGESDFDDRAAFFFMYAHRNAAPVVQHGHRTVAVRRDEDVSGEARQRFVAGVIYHLGDDVVGRFQVGVHARALPHRIQTTQDFETCFVVSSHYLFDS